ncbi:MAG: hypothetical protein FWG46_06800 [Treponema sp.]|nr:hypothetical protein [Treponema sp.]
MKKVLIVLICAALTAASYAADMPNRAIFIEGKAARPEQHSYFMQNFRMEGAALGYTIADNKPDAGYTFSFNVIPNNIMYSDGIERPAPPDEGQYLLLVTFTRNSDNRELVYLDFPFTELEEMYEHNQVLFFKATVYIPPINEADYAKRESQDWRNKWLYLRVSFDFPVTFYQLKGDGLYAGKGVYDGPIDSPTNIAPLDNRVLAMPAGTVGLEVHFLNFISIEPKFQMGWEYLNDTNLIMMAAGVDLKFPLKFLNNVLIEPYGALSFPVLVPEASDVFNSFPRFGFGGGVQIAFKGGKAGAFFADVSYMYFSGDAVIKNNLVELYPNPEVIHFQRSILGIGVGYKFGAVNRK